MPARKVQHKDKGAMSCNPPCEVAPAVGAYKTVELTRAIRIAAQMLGEAAVQVAPMFTAPEWDVLAQALKGRLIEPETPSPGPLVAQLVEQARVRYGVGAGLGGKPEAAKSLVDRLAKLTYVQTWAVIIAVRWRWDHAGELGEGEAWWEMATRWEHLRPDEEGE